MGYYKFTITKRRASDIALQFSELNFYDSDKVKIVWDVLSIQCNLSSTGSSESIDKIVDGKIDTKFCTTNFGSGVSGECIITIQTSDSMKYPSYYSYVTGNDSPERDPVSWTLMYSSDGAYWETIGEQNDEVITKSRKTETDLFSILRTVQKKYLIRDCGTIYTVVDGALSEIIGEIEITSSLFIEYGTDTIPDSALLITLLQPEILFWTDGDTVPTMTATVTGVPVGIHEIISNNIDLSHPSIFGITSVSVAASEGAKFLLSFDGGSYKIYNADSNTWEDSDIGMTGAELIAIPSDAWVDVINAYQYMNLKAVIGGSETVTNVKFNFDNESEV